jgi:hypothetical protein
LDKVAICGGSPRPLNNKNQKQVCDEYSYATTAPGGEFFYDLHQISLRLVPLWEQTIATSDGQGSKLNKFYRRAKVIRYDPLRGWFIVGTTNQKDSFWVPREGGSEQGF